MPSQDSKYFVSYAREDSEFALNLGKRLREAGAEFWLDQLDLVAGERWDDAVEESLKACGGLVVILSPDSVASNNVLDEVSYALEVGKPVVPVLCRPCEIPFRLRRVHYVDLTADFDKGFRKLLRAIPVRSRAEPAGRPEPEQAPGPPDTKELPDRPDAEKPPDARTSLRGRVLGALLVGGIGTVVAGLEFAVAGMLGLLVNPLIWVVRAALYGGVGGLIAGAICGMDRRAALLASIGALGWSVGVLFGVYEGFLLTGGLIVGAIIGAVLRRREASAGSR